MSILRAVKMYHAGLDQTSQNFHSNFPFLLNVMFGIVGDDSCPKRTLPVIYV